MIIKVFTVAEMVAAERAADAAGFSYDEMMETAGRRVAEAIMARTHVTGKSMLVLVGPGNNGGDGLVAGRYLAQEGADVAFYLFKPRDPEQDENYRLLLDGGHFVAESEQDQRYRVLRTRLQQTDVLIDALLGTGVTRPIKGPLARLLQQVGTVVALRRQPSPDLLPLLSVAKVPAPAAPRHDSQAPWPIQVVAVDCPSGLNCDTGELDPLAIPADLTVTFAGPKRGHFRFPGAAACGELVVADINIPNTLPEVTAVPLALVTPAAVRSLLPSRPQDGHKGTFGTLLVAAGSENYWGAPVLTAKGAYRAGAGLVALAVPEAIRATVACQLPEAIYPPLPASTHLNAQSFDVLALDGTTYAAMVVGPGLDSAGPFIDSLLANCAALPPLVIDADGLNILAGTTNWQQQLPRESILTPHPGEMARLLDCALGDLRARDRVEVARDAARAWGQVVLLKGAYTVVASPAGACSILPFANPLLAVGGSGDVLSGMIGAFLAQGLDPYDAAVVGAYLHGAAGALAAEKYGDAGLIVGELADWVPLARRRVEQD